MASSRRNPPASDQVPHPSSQSPKSAFFQRVPNPRIPISPSSISGCTPGRPSVPPRAWSLLPASGFRSQPQVIPPKAPPASGPPLRVPPGAGLPSPLQGPCSGGLSASGFRSPPQVNPGSAPQVHPLRYLPEQISLPRFGSSLRPPAHSPRAPSPQARSLRLGPRSPGPSAL